MISLAAAVASSVVALPVYWDKDATLSMVLILAPGVPLLALFLTSGSVLVGAQRGTARALLDPGSSLFLLAATIAVVEAHSGSRGYAAAYVARSPRALAATALAVQAVRPRFQKTRGGWLSMVRTSLPFGQFHLFAVVYARADSIMLS